MASDLTLKFWVFQPNWSEYFIRTVVEVNQIKNFINNAVQATISAYQRSHRIFE